MIAVLDRKTDFDIKVSRKCSVGDIRDIWKNSKSFKSAITLTLSISMPTLARMSVNAHIRQKICISFGHMKTELNFVLDFCS